MLKFASDGVGLVCKFFSFAHTDRVFSKQRRKLNSAEEIINNKIAQIGLKVL